jgi:hypothetical protein
MVRSTAALYESRNSPGEPRPSQYREARGRTLTGPSLICPSGTKYRSSRELLLGEAGFKCIWGTTNITGISHSQCLDEVGKRDEAVQPFGVRA